MRKFLLFNTKAMRLHNSVRHLEAHQIMREAQLALPRLVAARVAAREKYRPRAARADLLIDKLRLAACRLSLLDQRQRKSRLNRSAT